MGCCVQTKFLCAGQASTTADLASSSAAGDEQRMDQMGLWGLGRTWNEMGQPHVHEDEVVADSEPVKRFLRR